MNETAGFKPKKSVALSGVIAGNTALCTVGTTGNDLHYRGYDILEIANTCEFEEIAYLLIHERLPTRAELSAYKGKLKALRGLPAVLRSALEALPAGTHPMDVMRTAASVLGCTLPEKDRHDPGHDTAACHHAMTSGIGVLVQDAGFHSEASLTAPGGRDKTGARTGQDPVLLPRASHLRLLTGRPAQVVIRPRPGHAPGATTRSSGDSSCAAAGCGCSDRWLRDEASDGRGSPVSIWR